MTGGRDDRIRFAQLERSFGWVHKAKKGDFVQSKGLVIGLVTSFITDLSQLGFEEG